MDPCDNTTVILRLLEAESNPIALSQIMLQLGPECKERSVRRWLCFLVENGSVKKIGHKRGTKYIAIKMANKPHSTPSSYFGPASLQAIEMIKRPLFERKPISYMESWLDGYQPNSSYYLEEAWRKKLLAEGQRASYQDPAGTYAHKIFNRLMIDLSYNSSRLEGNTYSLLDTERLLLHGLAAEGKLEEETAMILNHKEAIRYLVESASEIEIHSNVICTLHFLLSDGLVEASEAGKIRRHGVRIGGSSYIPFEDPKRLEQQLEKITKKAAAIDDPFEQSIFLLIHISYLQAFADVNKRTARLSANISLIKKNLVPIAFSDMCADDYISAMIAIYELQDARPLADLYVYSYLRTCIAYDATCESIGFDEIRIRYRTQRRETIRAVLLQGLVGKKMQAYIQSTNQHIPSCDFDAFIEDVQEDLRYIDESRLAGLGVTLTQLQEWCKLRDKKS